MTNVYLNKLRVCQLPAGCPVQDIYDAVHIEVGLDPADFYLHQNGRIADRDSLLSDTSDVHIALRLRGGKGGFGSMLRAIGAQIEKTTNREACRDLSGRRLRDINEEKRLKTWLDGQRERDQETEERRKRKLVKLQEQPKHVFEDKQYESARQEMTQNVADSVEEGIRKAAELAAAAAAKPAAEVAVAGGSGAKRKVQGAEGAGEGGKKKAKCSKRKKGKRSALWIGGDISSATDSDDSDSESSAEAVKSK